MAQDSRGIVKEESLKNKLNGETGEGKTEVSDVGEEFEVLFIDSNRYYTVDKAGNVIGPNEIIEDKYPGDITKNQNGDTLDGSIDHPYEIWCIEDLVAFSNMVNGEGVQLVDGKAEKIKGGKNFMGQYVILKRSLNFKSKYSYVNSERTDFGDINGNEEDGNTLMNEMTTGTGFMPIGIKNSFRGEFNGNQEKIENIYINFENDTEIDETYKTGRTIGLFSNGSANTTVIKNLEISGEMIGKGHAGGIIGQGARKIENCINNANIKGFNMSGGIAGFNVIQISNCENYGKITITGTSYSYGGAGGIIGSGCENIKNCVNTGEITGSVSAGIIGAESGTESEKIIDSCINMGKSSSGICDKQTNKSVKILNCYNLGGCQNSGIFGKMSGSDNNGDFILSIYNSYNLGKTSKAGIIDTIGNVAKSMEVNIENVYNSGECTSAIIDTISNKQKATINIKNVYYNSDFSQKIGATEEGIQELKTNDIKNNDTFITTLNNNRKENQDWKKWIIGEDGYPTFEKE